MSSEGMKILADNRKARHEYTIEDSLEVGIVLVGTEVKSLRAAKFAFNDAHGQIKNGEVWLHSLQISPYDFASSQNHEPLRPRKLLLHRAEIQKLSRKVDERGYTLIPLKFYLKNGKVKILLGLCRGKKLHDKRASIKDRDIKRDMARESRL